MNNPLRGHIIRWVLILALTVFLFITQLGANPFSLDAVVKEYLMGMEYKGDVEVKASLKVEGQHSLLFVDDTYDLFHHIYFTHPLGLFWVPGSGSIGYEIDENVLMDFKGGMSTIKNLRFYEVFGQVHDPNVKQVVVSWGDGTEESTKLYDAFYLFTKAVPEELGIGNIEVYGYDSEGNQIYHLDYENRKVEKGS
jgi:hypothetical protein